MVTHQHIWQKGTYRGVWREVPIERYVMRDTYRSVWQEAPIGMCDERGTYRGVWWERRLWKCVRRPSRRSHLRGNPRLAKLKAKAVSRPQRECRSCSRLSEDEQTLEKGRRFHLHREKTLQPWSLCWRAYFLLWRKGDHFLTCLNKPKLWTKQSLFKAGCSSWSLASRRRKCRKNRHIFCERQVHHSSEMEDFATFSLLPDYVEATYF